MWHILPPIYGVDRNVPSHFVDPDLRIVDSGLKILYTDIAKGFSDST
jgi:hypothetical protein